MTSDAFDTAIGMPTQEQLDALHASMPKPRRRWRVTKAELLARVKIAEADAREWRNSAAERSVDLVQVARDRDSCERAVDRANEVAEYNERAANRWRVLCLALATAFLVLAVWR